jgi:hypothetical protein
VYRDNGEKLQSFGRFVVVRWSNDRRRERLAAVTLGLSDGYLIGNDIDRLTKLIRKENERTSSRFVVSRVLSHSSNFPTNTTY